jgi:hypothetical protein
MKKSLGALVLALSSLVISAACASTRAPSRPEPSQTDSGENWAKTGPSQLPRRTARSAGVQTKTGGR